LKAAYSTRFSALAAFSAVLGCGANPSGGPEATSGTSGAAGSLGVAGVGVGGASSTSAGSATTGGGGQAGGAGTNALGGSSGSSSTSGAGGGGYTNAGGSGGAAGSTDSGGGMGGSAGSAGANDGWVSIFNGKDLSGWIPLIHKSNVGENYMDTFTVDPVGKTIQIKYDKYPNLSFDDRCGLLYYDKPLTNYKVRATYRFLDPQAKNPVGWGRYNSGLMIFGQDPHLVQGDPMFPPLLELQLLGSNSAGGDANANLCKPGGPTVMQVNGHAPGGSCDHSMLAQNSAPPHADWVMVEAEVHVSGDTKVYQTYPLGSEPVLALTLSGPIWNGKPMTGGYLSLQSESQPCEFKDIQLKELPE